MRSANLIIIIKIFLTMIRIPKFGDQWVGFETGFIRSISACKIEIDYVKLSVPKMTSSKFIYILSGKKFLVYKIRWSSYKIRFFRIPNSK